MLVVGFFHKLSEPFASNKHATCTVINKCFFLLKQLMSSIKFTLKHFMRLYKLFSALWNSS